MNTRSRNRSPITPSDLSEMQPFSHGSLTSSLPLWMLGPSLLQPPFPLLFGLKCFSLLSSLCANSVVLFLCVLSSLPSSSPSPTLIFPSFRTVLLLLFPFLLAYCLCQMSWLLFFFSFSSLTPSLFLLLTAGNLFSCSCSSPLVSECLLLFLILLLHLPQCSINKTVLCLCLCMSRCVRP